MLALLLTVLGSHKRVVKLVPPFSSTSFDIRSIEFLILLKRGTSLFKPDLASIPYLEEYIRTYPHNTISHNIKQNCWTGIGLDEGLQ
jgi:hypothetical protein